MTSRLAALCLALSLAGLPAAAQSVIDSAQSDLNGDGLRERFTLLQYPGADTVDLIIEDTGYGRITASDIAWIGGIGQEPQLDLAPNGSVRLKSMNESVGRSRWVQTLTVAFRNGAYRVAGYTYDWYDTITGEGGECDLNLLNGRGLLRHGDGPQREVRADIPAMEISAWKDVTPIPEVCGVY
jgi:hypothetical protein